MNAIGLDTLTAMDEEGRRRFTGQHLADALARDLTERGADVPRLGNLIASVTSVGAMHWRSLARVLDVAPENVIDELRRRRIGDV
jgi:hypothetical protein